MTFDPIAKVIEHDVIKQSVEILFVRLKGYDMAERMNGSAIHAVNADICADIKENVTICERIYPAQGLWFFTGKSIMAILLHF
jgi:hypothetical protein